MSKYNFFKKILKDNYKGEIIEGSKKYKISKELKSLILHEKKKFNFDFLS